MSQKKKKSLLSKDIYFSAFLPDPPQATPLPPSIGCRWFNSQVADVGVFFLPSRIVIRFLEGSVFVHIGTLSQPEKDRIVKVRKGFCICVCGTGKIPLVVILSPNRKC